MDRPVVGTASRIVGLDLSKRTFVACALSGENFTKRTFFNGQMNGTGRSKLAQGLGKGDWVVMEGGSSTFNLARYLQKETEAQVFVFNPAKLHIIFESMCKTDKQDSAKLALYARDANPENWCLISIPTDQESAERSTITNLIGLKQDRVKYINRLHAVFNGQGFPDLKKSDLGRANGLGKRRKLIEQLLTEEPADLAALLADKIDLCEYQMGLMEDRLRQICFHHSQQALAWLSIPGIGMQGAATLIAYIGDGSRFSTASQLRNYVGLIPRKDQSGIIDKQLGIKSHGCMPIRRTIVQSGWYIVLANVECSLTRSRDLMLLRRKLRQRVAVALANKMLTIGFALLKNHTLYEYPGSNEHLWRKLRYYKLEAIIPCDWPSQEDGSNKN